MLKGFRDFLMRGNVVELATAVIIGAAFGGVVDGMIKGIIDPLIAVFAPGEVKQLENALVLGPFKIGLVLSALVNFLLKAGVVYFFIVKPFANLSARLAAAAPPRSRWRCSPRSATCSRNASSMSRLRTRELAALALALAATACGAGGSRPAATPAATPGPPATPAPSGFTLVFSDEFDAPGALDPAKWGYEIGYVRNDEKQYYTSRLENVRVEGGMLVIEGRKEAIRATATRRPASTRSAASSCATGASRCAPSCRPAAAPGRRSGCSARTSPQVGLAGVRRDRRHGERRLRPAAGPRQRPHRRLQPHDRHAEDREHARRGSVRPTSTSTRWSGTRTASSRSWTALATSASATKAPAAGPGRSTSRSTC